MLKQGLFQKLSQRISPQQIQFIKLLEIQTAELDARIKEELEENPALMDVGEPMDEADSPQEIVAEETDDVAWDAGEIPESESNELSLEEYLSDDFDYKSYLPDDPNRETYEIPIVQKRTLYDFLEQQVGMLPFDERQEIIAEHIIGNIDEDGYLRRSVGAIAAELAFKRSMDVEESEVAYVLEKIQGLDPPGVGAPDLKTCLLIQLKRKPSSPLVRAAIRVVEECFEEFTKKHFDKIMDKLDLDADLFKEVYHLITKLNPKPGESETEIKNQYIIPDFLLTVNGNEIEIKLNRQNAPELKVNKRYLALLKEYETDAKKTGSEKKGSKETLKFVKSKIESAKWFIDALKQRQYTLLKTMFAIADFQKDFFLSECDFTKLRPMGLKDIAEAIHMDESTVSRVTKSKYVQTDYGIFRLKEFFSEGVRNDAGEEVSNKEIKKILADLILNEDKSKPLSDDKLTQELNEKGYPVARRTVAKYREQLEFPVARMRKQL
jgi:RNA polymerase sigma-54 factor